MSLSVFTFGYCIVSKSANFSLGMMVAGAAEPLFICARDER